MITSIIILLSAFFWLGIETDWLRVRLPYGTPKVDISADVTTSTAKNDALESTETPLKSSGNGIIPTLLLSSGKITPTLLLDTVHDKPSVFIPLDMPNFTGELIIHCKRC